jgi:hypothetical protein
MQCKIIVFVNTISYVYRLVSLMSLLFGHHPAFMLNQTKKLKNKNQPTHHSPIAQETKCNSEGTRLLMEFLNNKYKSQSGEAYSGESQQPGHIKKKNLAQKTPSSQSSVSVLGIHSKIKQGDRLKRLEKY